MNNIFARPKNPIYEQAMSDAPGLPESILSWRDFPATVMARKAFIGHPAYTRAELDELYRKHAAEGPRAKLVTPDPWQQHPWDWLEADEIDILRMDESRAIREIRSLLSATNRPADVTDQISSEETIIAFEQAVEDSHKYRHWTDSALMSLVAFRRGFRSGYLYLLASYAIGMAVGFREARDLLLEGEDLLSDDGLFHLNLACYECRLGNLEATEQRLKWAMQLDEVLVAGSLDDPDLKTFWDPFCKKWECGTVNPPVPSDSTPHLTEP